ncbi:hypothetical protein K2173_025090 [Erythroxylum novogranatense]|uniref:Uncharacterized protein n=1 Tax=Erythroxylum novogranatense TaxID=1862640 RepID=A0AAV8SWA1_9ROSI|nr:hypothetical protein K2173_025090 [Erythroxylum novogranatense]
MLVFQSETIGLERPPFRCLKETFQLFETFWFSFGVGLPALSSLLLVPLILSWKLGSERNCKQQPINMRSWWRFQLWILLYAKKQCCGASIDLVPAPCTYIQGEGFVLALNSVNSKGCESNPPQATVGLTDQQIDKASFGEDAIYDHVKSSRMVSLYPKPQESKKRMVFSMHACPVIISHFSGIKFLGFGIFKLSKREEKGYAETDGARNLTTY